MNENKKIVSEKSFTIKMIQYDDGTTGITENVDGFNMVELIGILSIYKDNHMVEQLREMKPLQQTTK